MDDWQIKLYLVSKDKQAPSQIFYNVLFKELPKWLSIKNGFNSEHYNSAFLIIHVATEGIFCILNWWVGENMLNTHIFLSSHNDNYKFKQISGDGLSCCVWELEVIHHEKQAWIKHVLKNAPNMDYQAYLGDIFEGKL